MIANVKRYRVDPGQKFRIKDHDPDDRSLFKGGKAKAVEAIAKIQKRLDALQNLLYAEHRRKLLIILQGMDTSGKDGTIRHALRGFDPQGVRVESFKKPTEQELDHDFLWRVHAKVPGRGEVAIFNRSHYEDVLVVRVHELVPEETWRRRYEQINDFEKMLVENDTVILKFFLHISKDEQLERLRERIEDPAKRWKFQHTDIEERKLWDEYMEAYEEAMAKTTSDSAPWYVVPADTNWYRNYIVASVVAETLEKLKMKYPKIDLSDVKID